MKMKNHSMEVTKTAAWIKNRTRHFSPVTAIIAGSGLAQALPELSEKIILPYSEIPGFPVTTVKGHKGELVFGRQNGKDVVIMCGRFHYYEGHPMSFIAFPIRVLSALGVKTLIVTAAGGSLNKAICPGDFVFLKDHINFMGSNPLIGNYDANFGEMFPGMSEPYDAALRKKSIAAARKLKISAKEGVYLAVTGPSYETAAEVKVYRLLGGSVAGMSVVPEVIAARQLKMKVLGICWVANFTTGISSQSFDHEEVLKIGKTISVKMKELLRSVLTIAAIVH